MANSSANSRNQSGGTRKKPASTKSNSGRSTGSRGGKGNAKKNAPAPIRREVGAVVCAFLAIFTLIGCFHVDALFINGLCGILKGLFGWGFFLMPPVFALCAFILGFHRGRPVLLRVICSLVLPLVLGAMAHMLFCKAGYDFSGKFFDLVKDLYAGGKAMSCGGLIGGLIAMGLEAMFSIYGAFPILLAAFLFLLMASLRLRISQIISWFRGREKLEYEPVPEPEPAAVPVQRAPSRREAAQERRAAKSAIDIPLDEDVVDTDYVEEKVGFFNKKPRVKTPDQVLVPLEELKPEATAAPAPAEPEATQVLDEPVMSFDSGPLPTKLEDLPPLKEPPKPTPKASRQEMEAVKDEVAQEIEKAQGVVADYKFPPIELLRKGSAATVDGREEIALNRERLEVTIKSFGVSANIVGVTRGPTITRYDLELDVGVKLNKLTNLAGDLALALGVSSVRIAPIPDKISTVGIEVPNKIVSMVYLRDIIESSNFKNAKSSISFSVGKDIGGDCIVGNIAKLPHLLIAGTTGSGKSVCINSLILSLLYKSTPDEVRLIMIDPKMVELGVYNGIPHLYVPVVTDPKKAAGALQWAVVEMLKRYRLFSEIGVRDLAGYNAHQKKTGGQTMPQVVIVVDELADLMICAAKEVEESICRVAQMGRASGMHLIIATQRPSADVITGLMKANIPSRIAFAVSSSLESRIILDTQGAEKLIGMGDMLYFPLGSGKPMRVQGAFVSDEERENVIDFIKENASCEYSDEILSQIEKAAEGKGNSRGEQEAAPAPQNDYDELLPQAVDVIFETKQASVSMLQRRLKLGYSRAARLVDQMEELGIVGPFEGSKPRQIMITKQQWQEMQLVQGTAPIEQLPPEDMDGEDEAF